MDQIAQDVTTIRMVPITMEHFKAAFEMKKWAERNYKASQNRFGKLMKDMRVATDALSQAKLEKRMAIARESAVRWQLMAGVVEHLCSFAPGGQLKLFTDKLERYDGPPETIAELPSHEAVSSDGLPSDVDRSIEGTGADAGPAPDDGAGGTPDHAGSESTGPAWLDAGDGDQGDAPQDDVALSPEA